MIVKTVQASGLGDFLPACLFFLHLQCGTYFTCKK